MHTIPISTKEVVDHDYSRTTGDAFLSFIKAIVRDPEVRHDKLPSLAKMAKYLPGYKQPDCEKLKTVIHFNDKSNPLYLGGPVILAAGANKFGQALPYFSQLGFGGVTVGTVTGKKRDGNPHRPRIGMLHADRGINNAMGLNNPGIDKLAKIVDSDLGKCHRNKLSLGISIAENPDLDDQDEKLEELVYTFRKAYNVADYVEINVSCPNTGKDRADSHLDFLEKMLKQIMMIRKSLPVKKAVFAKMSPDMGEKQFLQTLDIIIDNGINGLVLFNTFPGGKMKYLNLKSPKSRIIKVNGDGGYGGISGRMLYENTFKATEFVKNAYPDLSIISCGGIDHGYKVWDLLNLGADAVQSYSVLAYRWAAIQKMNFELSRCLDSHGYKSIEDYLEKNRQLTL